MTSHRASISSASQVSMPARDSQATESHRGGAGPPPTKPGAQAGAGQDGARGGSAGGALGPADGQGVIAEGSPSAMPGQESSGHGQGPRRSPRSPLRIARAGPA